MKKYYVLGFGIVAITIAFGIIIANILINI
jgi:hypothetical protein